MDLMDRLWSTQFDQVNPGTLKRLLVKFWIEREIWFGMIGKEFVLVNFGIVAKVVGMWWRETKSSEVIVWKYCYECAICWSTADVEYFKKVLLHLFLRADQVSPPVHTRCPSGTFGWRVSWFECCGVWCVVCVMCCVLCYVLCVVCCVLCVVCCVSIIVFCVLCVQTRNRKPRDDTKKYKTVANDK